MSVLFTRSDLEKNLSSSFREIPQLKAGAAAPDMPEALVTWLAKLGLLNGVPFNYLVPDEGMFPPESIRFFYLDLNWIAALLDGALSIGRNLTGESDDYEINLQRAIQPQVKQLVKQASPRERAKAFGLPEAAIPETDIVTGFVLRSALVLEYPDMGVNVYSEDGGSLQILRYEQLGPTSDTLICLVAGDAYKVDIHEAPQALHYGIDVFNPGENSAEAKKFLYTFGNTTTVTDGVTTNSVTMSSSPSETDISSCIRQGNRVVQMSTLAGTILQKNQQTGPPPGTTAPVSIDSAEMGFEMTQGVGMVSFRKSQS